MLQNIKEFIFPFLLRRKIGISIVTTVQDPKATVYWFIFISWILTLLWFHPRMMQIIDIASNPLEWISLVFFVLFVELAWLYGIYNLAIVLFALYYKHETKSETSIVSVSSSKTPQVAILYTTCNDFSEPSAESCVKQDYTNYKVFLLDDSSDLDYQNRVDSFARKYPGKVEVVRRKTEKDLRLEI